MRGRDDALDVVRQWVVKAGHDLPTAAHTIKLGEECPTDTVCYHVQLKAAFVLAGVDLPKTHDLQKLTALVPPSVRPTLSAEELARLTEYAPEARYPGWEEIPPAEARRAVALARPVRREVRRRLPRKTLIRRRAAPKR